MLSVAMQRFTVASYLLVMLCYQASSRTASGLFALYGGIRPKHSCAHKGASAVLGCTTMNNGTDWRRLVPRLDANGNVLGFDSSPLPPGRTIKAVAPGQSTHIIKVTEDDEGLYGGVNRRTSLPAKCLTYLSIAGDCSRKADHLQLMVTKSSESVRPGDTLQLTSAVSLNGLPGSKTPVAFRYRDENNDEQIQDKRGSVSGAETNHLRLINIRCNCPKDILVLASTSTTSAHSNIHIGIHGHTYLEPKLPSFLHKTAGEQVQIVMKMRVCRQPQIRWKRGMDELSFFSTDKLSENRTLADPRLLVTFKYDPVEGDLTTAVFLMAAKLTDAGDYTIETIVGGNTTTTATTLQMSDQMHRKEEVPQHRHNHGVSTAGWIGIVSAIILVAVVIVLLLVIIKQSSLGAVTSTTAAAATTVQRDQDVTITHNNPAEYDGPSSLSEHLQWLQVCTRRHETHHLTGISTQLRRNPTVMHHFLSKLGLTSNELPNLNNALQDCYSECFEGLKTWEGYSSNQTVGALTSALICVGYGNIAQTVFEDIQPE